MRIGKLATRGVARDEVGPLEVTATAAPRSPEEWGRIFGRDGAPLRVEVGPGKGDWLREMARRHPEVDWVGIEVKRARAVWIEEKLLREGLENVRMMRADALKELPVAFLPGTLDGVYVNFFDPWPKKRHRAKRFAGPARANAIAQLLKVGGELTFVTDHPLRAAEARELFGAHFCLEPVWGHPDLGTPEWTERLPEYPQTIHEQKFRKWGRTIHFLRYRRRP